jgi:outer membrane protein TolC
VRNTWHEYWYLAQAIETVERMMQIVSHLEQVATSEYKANRAPYGTVLKAQVELGKLDDRVKTLRDMREPTSARLAAALNLPHDTLLPWPETVEVEDLNATDDQVLKWVQKGNPELAALAHEELANVHGIERAELQRYPDVTLGLQYVDTDSARMSGVSDSGKDPVLASLSVNVPIWADKYAAAEQEARERRRATANRRMDRENELNAEARMVLYQMRDAGRRMRLFRDTLVPKARQALEAQETAFSAGTTTFQQLLDAERVLLEFELEQHRAAANRAQRLAQLQMMAGRPLKNADATQDTQGEDNE